MNMALPKQEAKEKFKSWLGQIMRVKLSDGRNVMGQFMCTDSECNIILGMASEYIEEGEVDRKPRNIGLVMVPGNHIVTIHVDKTDFSK